MRRLLFLALNFLLLSGLEAGVVRHALWDANQKPMYQQCAKDFQAQNPQIRIRLQQMGWDDYWSALSTGFIANTAPDVFTNHLAKYPEFVSNGVLLDLAPLALRDKLDTQIYEDGLLQLWQKSSPQAGAQQLFALPADWDTIALIVNLDHAKKQGVSLADLRQMQWNAKDGGSFAQSIAKLTLDAQGRSALQTGFDPKAVKVYGYQSPESGGMMGQSQWSHFAASAGWRFQAQPWDAQLRYDDPVLIDTLAWLAGLEKRGWVIPAQSRGGLGQETLFILGRVAMAPAGAWMIGHFAKQVKFNYTWVPLPIGPSGARASMKNGLGHSIWAGSKNKEEAWAWLKYLGSRQCQEQVAASGMVFPAVKGLSSMTLQAHAKAGTDSQAFIDMAQSNTFPPPVAAHAAEIDQLLDSGISSVLSGRKSAASVMQDLAPKVRALAAQP